MKTKRTSQYANEHGLPQPDSARFEHGGGSTRNTKGEYVVLVCLPTDVASPCVHCFREAGSYVSVLHAYFSCTRMHISRVCAFLVYAHDTPPRVQYFSAFHMCIHSLLPS